MGWPSGGRGSGLVFGAFVVFDVAGRDRFEEAERGDAEMRRMRSSRGLRWMKQSRDLVSSSCVDSMDLSELELDIFWGLKSVESTANLWQISWGNEDQQIWELLMDVIRYCVVAGHTSGNGKFTTRKAELGDQLT